MRRQGKAETVSYAVLPDGYECIVWDADVQPIAEYRAGNSPGCSVTRLPVNHPLRVRQQTLRRWARQTAAEMAAEYGVGSAKVWNDRDAENDARGQN